MRTFRPRPFYQRGMGLWIAFCIAFALIGNGIIVKQWMDCSHEHGVFIRTAVWYSCIEKGQHQ